MFLPRLFLAVGIVFSTPSFGQGIGPVIETLGEVSRTIDQACGMVCTGLNDPLGSVRAASRVLESARQFDRTSKEIITYVRGLEGRVGNTLIETKEFTNKTVASLDDISGARVREMNRLADAALFDLNKMIEDGLEQADLSAEQRIAQIDVAMSERLNQLSSLTNEALRDLNTVQEDFLAGAKSLLQCVKPITEAAFRTAAREAIKEVSRSFCIFCNDEEDEEFEILFNIDVYRIQKNAINEKLNEITIVNSQHMIDHYSRLIQASEGMLCLTAELDRAALEEATRDLLHASGEQRLWMEQAR